MLRSSRVGLTLIELLVAVLLMGVVAASLQRLLHSMQRFSRYQEQRVHLNAGLRVAGAILPTELRGLDATGTAGSDILAMTDTAITYRAMRTLHFVCRPPTPTGRRAASFAVAATPRFGVRRLDPARDALLIFAEADPTTASDNYWVQADLSVGLTRGNACPGGAESLTLSVRNLPTEALKDVRVGAPIRGYEVMRLASYRDARGDWWVGARGRGKARGWSRAQPVLGPLAQHGLRFSYWNSEGAAVASPSDVARIGITLIARTSERVRTRAGATRHMFDTIRTQVALRNNRRSQR